MTAQKTPTALGTESIGKLLMQYAVPAIIAMTASSLYNMVDSIFIGHGVGTMALSALALTFPLMNLGAAFGAFIIRKSKFPQNPKRSVRFLGKGTKRSVQKRKAHNTQKAETKVL